MTSAGGNMEDSRTLKVPSGTVTEDGKKSAAPSGVLNVYKEKGITSFGVVARIRRIFGVRKAGHTGTLDPDASGVLVVCVGSATRLADTLTGNDKIYRAVMHLGIDTDTQDMSGKILSERNPDCTKEEVRDMILSFRGEIEQVPPMYSALKVNGQKLVDLARRGKTVERRGRKVTVYSIEIEEIRRPLVTMTVHCSKGTYIRTLCHDIGEKLGCGACLESLERLRTGSFDKKDSHTLAEIEKAVEEGTVNRMLIPTDRFFMDAPAAGVIDEDEIPLRNGNPFPYEDIFLIQEIPGATEQFLSNLPAGQRPDRIRLYTAEGQFAAVYANRKDKGLYWPEKMFL